MKRKRKRWAKGALFIGRADPAESVQDLYEEIEQCFQSPDLFDDSNHGKAEFIGVRREVWAEKAFMIIYREMDVRLPSDQFTDLWII
jgi:hypothetical protein